MVKNYFKIAWRNIVNNKAYSAINILGLAAGMAVALLIALWVNNEYSYDRYLPDAGRLYQVRRNFNSNGETLTFSSTSLKLADALRTIPEVEYVAPSDGMGSHGLMVGDKKLYMDGPQVGTDYLKMFKYPMLQGNAASALTDAYSIVLCQSTAIALFGTIDVMNKVVKLDNAYNLKVTGVIKDVPANSSYHFQYILPFSLLEQTQAWAKGAHNSFGFNAFSVFVKLKPGIAYAQVAPKIKNIEKGEDNINAKNSDVIFQPMPDWHLYSDYKNGVASGGFIEYVRMFSIIGILVLLIACVNFINLTTARSEKRAREVGIRKAIGSQRKHLIFQFLIESALITFIAFLCSILFVQIALAPFNALTGTTISIPFSSGLFWLVMMGCVLLTALIAGSRPAFYLSSFNPVKVLKGTIQLGRSASLSRKVLVVMQFSCSIALIISTVVIYRQIQYAKNRPTGYSINRLLTTNNNTDLAKNYVALKYELLQSGLVDNVTTASSAATDVNAHNNIDHWPGKMGNETVEMGVIEVNDDYFKTLGMQMADGRDFYSKASDTSGVIFNQAAITRLRLKNPVGQTITQNGMQLKIVGVVKDALMLSPFAKADPTMFMYTTVPHNTVLYRLAQNANPHQAIDKLTQVFNKYSPAYPYTYRFVDDDYNQKFSQEVLIGKLSGIFAGLAIFISCLGLFGLAAYIAEQRTKEIGVRKVLGATVSQLWFLLSKDFVLLVIISCVIASPIALYFLQGWLQKYDYRISIGPGVFIISALAAVMITLATISFQAIKAAIANPVKSLRSE